MASQKDEKVIIIGSGPAGYTAAIYAARALLRPVLITGDAEGGQLMLTTDVENYPGFADVIQGPWLMEQMKKQAIITGTRIIEDQIKKVDFSNTTSLSLFGEDDCNYTSKTVIIACGAQAKWLGLESETKFRGAGVSACAVCDGFFFKNLRVAVVGGGNTALEEALYLTNFAKKVTIIHRRDQFRGEKILQKKVLEHEKIDIIWNHRLIEILGEEQPRKVKQLRLQSVVDKSVAIIDIDGIFIAIGHTPRTEPFIGQVAMDEQGYIDVLPGTALTSVKGVFAAGDVTDKVYRQAVTAAALGCMAAFEAEKFIALGN